MHKATGVNSWTELPKSLGILIILTSHAPQTRINNLKLWRGTCKSHHWIQYI